MRAKHTAKMESQHNNLILILTNLFIMTEVSVEAQSKIDKVRFMLTVSLVPRSDIYRPHPRPGKECAILKNILVIIIFKKIVLHNPTKFSL